MTTKTIGVIKYDCMTRAPKKRNTTSLDADAARKMDINGGSDKIQILQKTTKTATEGSDSTSQSPTSSGGSRQLTTSQNRPAKNIIKADKPQSRAGSPVGRAGQSTTGVQTVKKGSEKKVGPAKKK